MSPAGASLSGMTNFGATAQAEIDKVKRANDQLLEKIMELVTERDLAREEANHLEAELSACYETNGVAL